MRSLRFIRLSQIIEKIFGPTVANFFNDIGIYIALAFIGFFVLYLLFSWLGLIRQLIFGISKFLKLKTSKSPDDLVENNNKSTKKIFKIFISGILLFFFVLVLVSLLIPENCSDTLNYHSTNIAIYSELRNEKNTEIAYNIKSLVDNELLDDYLAEYEIINTSLNNEYESVNEFLVSNPNCIETNVDDIRNPKFNIEEILQNELSQERFEKLVFEYVNNNKDT